MSSIQYHKDEQGIVHLILDKQGSPVNLMDQAFLNDLSETVAKLEQDEITGVIFQSAKSTFFAGGDIDMLYQTTDENAADLFNFCEQMKADFRKLECLGKPVVSCINGAALGGGLELALASHYRIAINSTKISLGLPEVNWGLLPGGGGVTRMVRLLGLDVAMPYLTQGKLFKPEQGYKLGLVHALADSPDQMLAMAINWINSHPESQQPYDVKGYKIPGLAKSRLSLPVAGAVVKSATKGTLPAPQAILSAMVEGSQVDFDTASRIESRYFVELARGQVAKNLINTFWYQQNEIKSGKNRPNSAKTKFTKVGVLGAGMMGAGIAYACASKGIEVVLKDTTKDIAEKGKDYSRLLLKKRLDKGRTTQQKMAATLDLISTTERIEELSDCQLVIEAVFENRELKAKVTQEAETILGDEAVFASNTSTLPITGLAQASKRAEQFIGIHFFSPVDKMPLVEIICGEKTSNETLAKAYDLALQIGKTPIVVNDSRGFYTSRVFKTYVKEGAALLSEADAAEIENAAWLAGFPVGPLAVTDEVSFSLIDKITKQTAEDLAAEGKSLVTHPADDVIAKMLEQNRLGKVQGAGYYNYPESETKHLWSELTRLFKKLNTSIPLQDIKDRLLFIMAIETARIYEEQVLHSIGDANIGSIFGLGYPTWTGGTLQFINAYGVSEFVKRADELAEKYGERFTPTTQLREMATATKSF